MVRDEPPSDRSSHGILGAVFSRAVYSRLRHQPTLYVLLVGFIAPNNFTISESIRFLVMLVIGGLGSIPDSYVSGLVTGATKG